ncbi:MAG: 6-bladed beta-propeller [Balneolaceae bacterium]
MLLICTVACSGNEYNSNLSENIQTYRIDPGHAAGASLDEVITDIEFIALKLPDSLHLSVASKVVFRDSLFYILDRTPTGSESKIFAFDLNGDFRFVIDRPGEGPGEYDYIYDLALAGEMIALATSAHLLIYSFDGELIQRHVITGEGGDLPGFITSFDLLDDGAILFTDTNGRILRTDLPVKHR